jgi:sulfide:quinone oxidoreductase
MTQIKHPEENIPSARRAFLGAIGGLAGAGLLASASPAAQAAAVNTKARIVIAGGGAAGLTAASHLAKALSGATITIIDGRKAHYYQPGFTLVAAGIKPKDYVISTTREYVPKGSTLINEGVAEIDP